MTTHDSSRPPAGASPGNTGQWYVRRAAKLDKRADDHEATLAALVGAIGVAPNPLVGVVGTGLYGGLGLVSAKLDALAAGFADDRAAAAQRRAFALWVGRVAGGGAIIGLLGVVGTWFAHHWH